MKERTNKEWLADLQGPGRDEALADLRVILVRGLHYAVANRYNVPEPNLEDFAQEALLKILATLDSFRGESRFTTWAHKIAVNVAFSELRRKRWENVSLQDLIAQYEGDFTPSVLTDPPLFSRTKRGLTDAYGYGTSPQRRGVDQPATPGHGNCAVWMRCPFRMRSHLRTEGGDMRSGSYQA